ncbi:MAG: hypothetical protein SGJ20_21425 [Planctomycetota bacterium]|nr:hypothetical protein [Planctomycetota bacterium]
MAEENAEVSSGFRSMIDDLSMLAIVPAESLEALSKDLEQSSGFMAEGRLFSIVSNRVQNDEQASAVFNVLQNVPLENISRVLKAVDKWRCQSAESRQRFPDALYASLQQGLPILVRDYAAINQLRKSEILRGLLGNEWKAAAFICDARPIYNETRDDIEGFIPVTTLKVVYEKQNEFPEEIEFVLSPEQIEELIDQAKAAQKKLEVLYRKTSILFPSGLAKEEE